MRPGKSRVLAALALAAVMALAVSGCARIELSDDWPDFPAPAGWEPKAGACTEEAFAETSYRTAYKPIDCTKSHFMETAFVGAFTGDAASAATPPAPDSAALGAAWRECGNKITEYLGGPWQDGRIWFGVSVPSAGNWEGGARWYRCEVTATTDIYLSKPMSLTTSLKGVFAAPTQLRYGCFKLSDAQGATPETVDCTAGHNGEYVGSFEHLGGRDEVVQDRAEDHRKCRSLIATYAGVPDDSNMQYRAGTYMIIPAPEQWDSGDHWVRCHLWMGTKNLTKSVKGGGTSALPINYA